MFLVQVTDTFGARRRLQLDSRAALIGCGDNCEIRLDGWRVGREHARLTQTGAGLLIEDLGYRTGTWINGARIARHGPLTVGDEIGIGGFRLRVQDRLPRARDSSPPPADAPAAKPSALRDGRNPVDQCVRAPSARALPADGATGKEGKEPTAIEQRNACSAVAAAAVTSAVATRSEWRRILHEKLLDAIDLRRRDLTRMNDDEVRAEAEQVIRDVLAKETALPAEVDRAALLREVLHEAIGLGPLEDLLADESVTEIMVNRFDEVYVERGGQLQRHETVFSSNRAVLGVIERIVAPLGRRIDESSPLVDARLKDGSRVNAIIAPLALKGPALTIRKFSRQRLAADDLVTHGSLSPPMAELLRLCVTQRKNVVVAGGTGSGKTTLLNVLSNFIPDGERIVTIEDAAELKLNHSHLVALESRPANVEGRGLVAIRDLLRNALRMRPDRIVVGECRGGEALDMLQAMNTGHEGSMTTLHANTPRDAVARLETLVLMAGMDLPLAAIRDQIAAAVDILIQQTRFACGARKVTSITEVTGVENGRLQLQEIFRYTVRGFEHDGKVRGEFGGCGTVPTFCDELRARGVAIDLSIFAGTGERDSAH